MRKYLIGISTTRGDGQKVEEHTIINGDSFRPFMIAHNLWNYTTPWNASQRLKSLGRCWEALGASVNYIYGTVADMPTQGDTYNVGITLAEYGAKL